MLKHRLAGTIIALMLFLASTFSAKADYGVGKESTHVWISNPTYGLINIITLAGGKECFKWKSNFFAINKKS